MEVIIGGTRSVRLDKTLIIGQGGEANVYRDPERPNSVALKILHQPDRDRIRKLTWFTQAAPRIPARAVAPKELVTSGGKVVGFSMRLLSRRYVKMSQLFVPSFCASNGVNTRVVADIGLGIAEDLRVLHPGLCVGDFNDGGVMVHEEKFDIAWVDVDSFHSPQFPCVVGTELYLSPDLYGVDLSTGSYFKPEHDWFSYAVLLFRLLLRKHPFKAGQHKHFLSVLDRAQNGATVLDASVSYPDVGLKPEILGDELTTELLRALKRKSKGPFSIEVLQRYRDSLIECKGCHVWYPAERKACPQCSEKTSVDIAQVLGIRIVALIESRGRILYTTVDGDTIYCVAEELGKFVLYRRAGEKGTVLRTALPFDFHPRMRFGVVRDLFVVSVDDDQDATTGPLYLFEMLPDEIRPVAESSTEIFSGRGPVFATSGRYLYRIAGNYLVATDRFVGSTLADVPISQVFRNQSWFTCLSDSSGEREIVVGLNRDVAITEWFIASSNRAGKNFEVARAAVTPLDRRESLSEVSVRMHGDTVLLARKTTLAGREIVRLDRLKLSGELESSSMIDLSSPSPWEQIHGKAYVGAMVMHPTDQGAIREELGTGQMTPLSGTARIVTADSKLQSYGDGLLSVSNHRVLYITRKS